jgi:ABC-type multidrug transport system fused ATPase/permease subunit
VREIPQKQLHKIVAVALQESVLFTGTVRGNILMGKQNAGMTTMLVAAAEAADADSFIRNIPEVYDALVSHAGPTFPAVSANGVYCPGVGRRPQGPDPG